MIFYHSRLHLRNMVIDGLYLGAFSLSLIFFCAFFYTALSSSWNIACVKFSLFITKSISQGWSSRVGSDWVLSRGLETGVHKGLIFAFSLFSRHHTITSLMPVFPSFFICFPPHRIPLFPSDHHLFTFICLVL